ncbi:MAG: Icc protein, partial [Francisellaceae bacterium]
MPKILLITDMHVTKDGLNGINTIKAFSKVIIAAKNNSRYDSIILCGDLSQNGDVSDYELICGEIRQNYPDMKTYLIAGNHDDQENLKSVTKCIPNISYMDNRYIDILEHRFIFLNSNITGRSEGNFLIKTLAWLSKTIKLSNLPVYIFTHHHTLPINLNIDHYILKNNHEFLALLKEFSSKITMVICGHTHYFTDKDKHGIRFITLPSSSMQYSSMSNFTPDNIQM